MCSPAVNWLPQLLSMRSRGFFPECSDMKTRRGTRASGSPTLRSPPMLLRVPTAFPAPRMAPAEYWTIHTTHVPRSSAAPLCLKSLRAATILPSAAGAGSRRWPRRSATGPICWRTHLSAMRTVSSSHLLIRIALRHNSSGRIGPNSCKLRIRVFEQEIVMSIHPIMQKLAAKLERTDLPSFAPGDTVRVQVKIREGEKERLQAFEGMVIATRKGPQGTFTVRKMSFGQGVE